jgi:polar amino acid transport system substrate-binding protein
MISAREFARRTFVMLFACVMLAVLASASDTDTDSFPPHNPECTIKSFLEPADGIPSRVYPQLAPTGILKIGVNYGNPNNAKLDSGKLQGLAVDLGCILARKLGLEVEFVRYPGVPQLMQGFTNGEWTLGFTFDPQLGPPNFAYAHPHLAVENTYLVPANSTFQTVSDVDQSGVRISVATGNSPDVYLTAHLQHATLVRFPTVPQALAALKNAQVDAFAGSRSAEVAFLPQLPPGSRVLNDDFLIANLAAVMAMDQEQALRFLNRFIEQSKMDFLIQLGIARAGLIGVNVPDPIRRPEDDED